MPPDESWILVALIGLWLVVPALLNVLKGGGAEVSPRWMLGYALCSALVAVPVFFAFFMYFLMFCLPVGFFVAAMTYRYWV
jgi:hypothetical protein